MKAYVQLKDGSKQIIEAETSCTPDTLDWMWCEVFKSIRNVRRILIPITNIVIEPDMAYYGH